MTDLIQNGEQLLATALTGQIIAGIAKSDAAKRVSAANTVLAVATAIQAIGNGDAAGGTADLTNVFTATSLDPAVAAGLLGLVKLGMAQLSLASSVAKFIPIFGATASAVLENIAAGAITAANLEIKKYGTTAITPPPATLNSATGMKLT